VLIVQAVALAGQGPFWRGRLVLRGLNQALIKVGRFRPFYVISRRDSVGAAPGGPPSGPARVVGPVPGGLACRSGTSSILATIGTIGLRVDGAVGAARRWCRQGRARFRGRWVVRRDHPAGQLVCGGVRTRPSGP